MAVDGEAVGVIALADTIRASSAGTIRALKKERNSLAKTVEQHEGTIKKQRLTIKELEAAEKSRSY